MAGEDAAPASGRREHNRDPAASPAFQFYPADWLSDHRLTIMTPAERGACLWLCCFMWKAPSCSLPDDDEALATYSGLGEGWLKGGSRKVREFFETRDGYLTHPWLLRAREKQREWSEKSRQGGLKSGSARRQRKRTGGSGETTSTAKGGSQPETTDAGAPGEVSSENRAQPDTKTDSKGGSLFSLQSSSSFSSLETLPPPPLSARSGSDDRQCIPDQIIIRNQAARRGAEYEAGMRTKAERRQRADEAARRCKKCRGEGVVNTNGLLIAWCSCDEARAKQAAEPNHVEGYNADMNRISKSFAPPKAAPRTGRARPVEPIRDEAELKRRLAEEIPAREAGGDGEREPAGERREVSR